MSKRCAREECGKIVYPLEELKCLDKVWHKGCFRCTVCGMALNMKNYKGYNKMPYCEPHYPKTVASVVSDTPEMRRIAGNTKLQSQVQYHAEYEKMKGTKIQIADDPEISRHMLNTKVQSQVAYTGELLKKQDQEQHRSQTVQALEGGVSNIQISSPQPSQCQPQVDTPYTSRLAQQSGTLIYSSEHGGSVNQSAKPVGSIADYDPLNGNWGTVGGSRTDQKLNGSTNGTSSNISASQQPLRIPVIQTSPHTPRFCSDFVEEAASRNGGLSPASSMSPGRTSNGSSVANSIETGKGYGAGATSGATGFSVKAIYDYTAADKDEVTFLEGDVIVNCQKVDEGWMTGTVQRTLQWGMLPANYVEPHKIPTGLGRLK